MHSVVRYYCVSRAHKLWIPSDCEVVVVANRPQPSEALWRRETAKLQAAIDFRDQAQKDAVAADMKLRRAIKAAFKNGLAASYISEATGLTVSRCYQISRGTRT